MKYRKKPVVVDAWLFNGSYESYAEVPSGGMARWFSSGPSGRPPCVEIQTLEGTMTAMPGDYIIRGVKGEFYPCKPDIFAVTYELEASAPLSPIPLKRENFLRLAHKVADIALGNGANIVDPDHDPFTCKTCAQIADLIIDFVTPDPDPFALSPSEDWAESDRQQAVKFLLRLASENGAIVSSGCAHEIEIADARQRGDWLNIDGLGFILRFKDWRERAEKAIHEASAPLSPAEQRDHLRAGSPQPPSDK